MRPVRVRWNQPGSGCAELLFNANLKFKLEKLKIGI